MSNIYDNQIKEMQRLINYGKQENTTTVNSQPIVEYHSVGADGKTYGIIREGHNFYIKVAPKKDTQVLAEDYDYIGGFNNKKENEYSSYTLASKQFDLKMKALNEACNKKVYTSQYTPSESAEWQINETKEMRKELNRFNQIVENVNKIIEGKDTNFIGMAHEVPEAPAKNPSQKKVNAPFTDVAVAPEDKDLKYAQNQFTKSGPYSEGGTVTNKDMESDKRPKGNKGDVYTEKGKINAIPNGKNAVADKKVSGGKVVKVNEGRTIKINEEQVLAWSKSKDFMDKSKGTKIGSSAPFSDEVDGCANGTYCEADTEPIHEEIAVHNTDNQNKPKPGVSKPRHCGDPFEETVNEETINIPSTSTSSTTSSTPKLPKMTEAVVDANDVEGFDDDDEVDFNIVDDTDVDEVGFEGDGVPEGPTDDDLANALDGVDFEDLDVDGGGGDGGDDDYEGGLTDDDLRDDSFITNPDDEDDDDMEDIEASAPVRPGQGFRFLDHGPEGEPRMMFPQEVEPQILARKFGGTVDNWKRASDHNYKFTPSSKKASLQRDDEPSPSRQDLWEPDQGIDRSIDYEREDEGFNRYGETIYEVKLNDFGKHPAYRKEVMTLPPNTEIDRYGRDWNDKSARGSEPFGKKIGSSAPYTEEVIEMLTDAIVNKLSKKKI